MSDSLQVVELLSEMRDHLAILAEAALPAHDEAVLARLGHRVSQLQAVVNTPAQWDSLALMNGDRPLAAIAAVVGVDPSNFRKFVGRLVAGGFVIDGPKGPRLTLSSREAAAVRRRT